MSLSRSTYAAIWARFAADVLESALATRAPATKRFLVRIQYILSATRHGVQCVKCFIGVSPTLSLKNGLLSFDMEGEKCNETSKYVTNIKLVCSYQMLKKPIKIMVSFKYLVLSIIIDSC